MNFWKVRFWNELEQDIAIPENFCELRFQKIINSTRSDENCKIPTIYTVFKDDKWYIYW